MPITPLGLLNKYKGFLFDFDYTIVDSSDAGFECINHGMVSLGIPAFTKDPTDKTIGLNLKETFMALTSSNDWRLAGQFKQKFIEKADEVMVEKTQVYPATKPLLALLKYSNVQVGIVSTKYRYRIEAILKQNKLFELFDFIIGGEDVEEQKPNPEGFRHAIKRMKLSRREVCYIGDSLVDAETCKMFDMDFLALTTGTTHKHEFKRFRPVAILKSLEQLGEQM